MISNLAGKTPEIHENNFVAKSSAVVGGVHTKKNVSIWFSAVLRGDFDSIYIDENTNIQDNATVHCDATHTVRIGKNVSVGHNAVIHGAVIGDNVLIGMNSTVLNGAVIGNNCIIGAGAMVPEGKVIPDNSLVVGVPAKVIKTTTEQQVEYVIRNANHYWALAEQYKAEGLSEV